jgi:hypothetical protein
VATGEVKEIRQRARGGETDAVTETIPWSATGLERAVIFTFPAAFVSGVPSAEDAEPPRASRKAPTRLRPSHERVPTPFTAGPTLRLALLAVYGHSQHENPA